MITKREIKKNRLDLEFRSESQKSNIWLSLGTITSIGFFASMIIQKYYLLGSIMALAVFVVSMFLFRQTQARMRRVLTKIENL